MKLTPIGDKIVVKRLEAEAKTKGGIVLPDSAQEKPKRGKVIAVGEGKRLDSGEIDKPSVKKGDEVIFSSFAGTEITIDREEFLIMSQSDILAVIKK
ncbi:MAG: co-chaperone GroES [Phycisphaerae bacterium]